MFNRDAISFWMLLICNDRMDVKPTDTENNCMCWIQNPPTICTGSDSMGKCMFLFSRNVLATYFCIANYSQNYQIETKRYISQIPLGFLLSEILEWITWIFLAWKVLVKLLNKIVIIWWPDQDGQSASRNSYFQAYVGYMDKRLPLSVMKPITGILQKWQATAPRASNKKKKEKEEEETEKSHSTFPV